MSKLQYISIVLKNLATILTLMIVPSTMFAFLEELYSNRVLEDLCTGNIYRHKMRVISQYWRFSSQELQTCDWPRNVGCDGAEIAVVATTPSSSNSRTKEEYTRTRYTPPPPPKPSALVISRGQPRQQQIYHDDEINLKVVKHILFQIKSRDKTQFFYLNRNRSIQYDLLLNINSIKGRIKRTFLFSNSKKIPTKKQVLHRVYHNLEELWWGNILHWKIEIFSRETLHYSNFLRHWFSWTFLDRLRFFVFSKR